MEPKEKKTFHHIMRALHRDIGFFMIGIIVIFALSGITLVYRDTDFLKQEKLVEKKFPPNLDPQQLGQMLHMREFRVINTEGDTIFFPNGSYNSSTGAIKYTGKEIIFPINKFIDFHKKASQGELSWINVIIGILLFFLALSSFWMFKSKSKLFHRGLLFAGTGIVFAIVILII